MDQGDQNVVPIREPDEPGSPQSKPSKAKPSKFLPTDRIAWARWFDMLRGYAIGSEPGGKPVTNKEAAGLIQAAESTVALANPFLTENGFLTRTDAGFIPAVEILAFKRAHEWNPESAAQKLAPLLSKTWFAQEATKMVAVNSRSEDDVIQRLGEIAQAGPEYRSQVKALVEWLVTTGVVRRDGGMLLRAFPASQTPEPSLEDSAKPPATTPAGKTPVVATSFTKLPEGVVRFNVNVEVTMSEFGTWRADRITAFFQGLAMVLSAKSDVERDQAREEV